VADARVRGELGDLARVPLRSRREHGPERERNEEVHRSELVPGRGGLVEALEKVFEEAASPLLPSAARLFVAFPVVVAAPLAWSPPSFNLTEKLFVGVARSPLSLFDEDAVEFAPVEPYAAALRARVNQDLASFSLDEPGTVERAT
jgi:hypothetical protein